MSKMQRTKGKRFEQQIAARLRAEWPTTVVRRASQAERADNPDVFVEGGPRVLEQLWLELQDARAPTPLSKLEQAERDTYNWAATRSGAMRGLSHEYRLPVVVWHKLAERTVWVTTRLQVVDYLRGFEGPRHSTVVTLEWSAFVDLLHLAASREAGESEAA